MLPSGISVPKLLDFGTLHSTEAVVSLPLSVSSSLLPPVRLLSVVLEDGETAHLKLSPHGGPHDDSDETAEGLDVIELPPHVPTPVADVSFVGREQGSYSGNVIVTTDHPDYARLVVPYEARVLHGEMRWGVACSGRGGQLRALTVVNGFASPVALLDASVADTNFQLHNFTSGRVLAPGEEALAAQLTFVSADASLM